MHLSHLILLFITVTSSYSPPPNTFDYKHQEGQTEQWVELLFLMPSPFASPAPLPIENNLDVIANEMYNELRLDLMLIPSPVPLENENSYFVNYLLDAIKSICPSLYLDYIPNPE